MSREGARACVDVLKAALLQMPHGESLDANLDKARAMAEGAAAAGARLALLPEYFFATFDGGPETAAPHAARIRDALARMSAQGALVVGANVIERAGDAFANVGVVYEDGRLVLEQPKVHPMPREAASGVRAGDAFRAAPVAGRTMGLLVCADVLYPEAARVLALQGAQVLLNPVMSPYREDDLTRGSRDAIFVARAYDSGAFVLKAGGFRRPTGAASAARGPPAGIAGRSLAAAPWGVLAKARDDFAEEILVAQLDFETLRRFREHQAGFPARQPGAYRDLA